MIQGLQRSDGETRREKAAHGRGHRPTWNLRANVTDQRNGRSTVISVKTYPA
jgi:hypothetical protein